MRKITYSAIIVLVVCGFVFGGWAIKSASAVDKVTFNLVSFVPKMNISYRAWAPRFVDKVNKRSKGELFIKYRGGPEVIAAFDQAKAVAKGTIDMALVPTTFYAGLVPGVDTTRLSEISVAEERVNGTYNLMREIHSKAGIYFLGNSCPINGHFYYICLKKPVKARKDFKGLKIGGSPPFLPVFKAWGATPVKAALPQYYPSVERGILDGNMIGMDVYLALAEYEVAPYVIDHPFYKSTNVVIINLKKWESLPDHLKKLLTDVQLETEKEMPAVWDKAVAKMREKAISGGAKFIKFPPDVAKWYLDIAYRAGWEYSEEKYPKDLISRFRKLITK